MNFPQLDPSEFPTLNRTSSQNIVNRLNSFSNVPQSAPILTSQQQANIQSLLTNSLYSQSNTQTPNNVLQNLTNQLQNMNPFNSHNNNNNNNNSNSLLQQQHHQQQHQQVQQHQQSNTSTSGKMWSSFGSSLRDNSKKIVCPFFI
jgi:hypothetical protein